MKCASKIVIAALALLATACAQKEQADVVGLKAVSGSNYGSSSGNTSVNSGDPSTTSSGTISSIATGGTGTSSSGGTLSTCSASTSATDPGTTAAARAAAASAFDTQYKQKILDFISSLTLHEKVGQVDGDAWSIPRLNVPQYNWWNEALHGVARAGTATVFPQAIGMAAMWDTPLLYKIGTAIGDEGRAKYNQTVKTGQNLGFGYYGLTFWAPNINIFRDPRWGRGQETYGEDPFLTSRNAVAFITGMQGNDPTYLKVAALAKHFAAHSGPEGGRESFNSVVSARDMSDTYLPAFKIAVQEAQVAGLMCSYNAINGVPSCADSAMLLDVVRSKWGFAGYTTSDCGAIANIATQHKYAPDLPHAAAVALKAGTNLDCGSGVYSQNLENAVSAGLVAESDINNALVYLYTIRAKLLMMDKNSTHPYTQIPMSVVDSVEHRQLARQAADESMVLLKNQGGLLPLNKNNLHKVAVVGPNANDTAVLLGNYNGTPSYEVTFYDGIKAALPAAQVDYLKGDDVSAAVSLVRQADVAILVLGILRGQEDEGTDRSNIELANDQEQLLEQVYAAGKPVVLVLVNGSAVAINWANSNIPAIVEAWYPGQESGNALADVLFGTYNPSGRLPVTFYQKTGDLPALSNYAMTRRTYRYFTGSVLYPFGYGLSYTQFQYSNLQLSAQQIKAGDCPLTVTMTIKNAGTIAGDDVPELYLKEMVSAYPAALQVLKGFQKIHLEAGAQQTVTFPLKPEDFMVVNNSGELVYEPGAFTLTVGPYTPAQGVTFPSSANFISAPITLQ